MISDILSDAAAEIRHALEERSNMYADTAPLINDLLMKMDAVRALLDRPPAAPH